MRWRRCWKNGGATSPRRISTADALERIGALGGEPNAIIADLHLDAGESGLEAVNMIRQHTQSEIPAMVVTADYSADAAHEAGIYGLELLKKPIRPAELRSLLSYLLGLTSDKGNRAGRLALDTVGVRCLPGACPIRLAKSIFAISMMALVRLKTFSLLFFFAECPTHAP